MGGVWCKADKGQRPYSPKGPFNTAISRWTDHMRQAYRKPKQHHRPPRPPQKPSRTNERLTISAPTLVREASSDGWRTATLIVPESHQEVEVAPVPPPRKKRKRNRDLNRSAVSMDDLNRGSSYFLSKSTISLPDKCSSDTLDSRSSSSTLVVTPILEPRVNHEHENKENKTENRIEEEDEEEIDITDQPEIIPVEKETLFTSRTLLHSNLGFVDKLSAISEVSAESGFDDKTDVKYSESESVTSIDSVPREALNILAHIHDINNVRETTAISKKEWLQNILKVDSEPYFISKDTRRASDGVAKFTTSETTGPNSLPDHLQLSNRETETEISAANKTSPINPNGNHSVLLDIIQRNKDTPNFPDHKEESIFLTNTKTNIIYKSLSSDKLTDYDYSGTIQDNVNGLTSNNHLSDYSFHSPKLVESDAGLNSLLEGKRSNIVTSFDFKEIRSSNCVTNLHSLQPSVSKVTSDAGKNNGVDLTVSSVRSDSCSEEIKNSKAKESIGKKDSVSSSRKSSITDSLHEFEMSIYDMLKESKKNENSSDEEESLKTVK